MFGFIQEIKDSVAKGWAEGMAEVDQAEAEASNAQDDVFQRLIEKGSEIERLGTAMGAHYLEVYTRGIGLVGDPQKAARLQLFELAPEDRDDLAALLKRDFQVVDGTSLYLALREYWEVIHELPGETPDTPNMTEYALYFRATAATLLQEDRPFKSLSRKERAIFQAVLNLEQRFALGPRAGDAAELAKLAYLISASVGLGYVSEVKALPRLQAVINQALALYGSWDDFAFALAETEVVVSRHNIVARKLVLKAIERLRAHKYSPWNSVPWPQP